MSADRVVFLPRAAREIKAVPASERRRLRDGLEHPRIGALNLDIKPLSGHPPYKRLRIGACRVIYTQDVDAAAFEVVFTVVAVVNRRDLRQAVKKLR
jgi:mRNA-degrading endonuclease RelE of RelBE toxin-antitoxin system